MPVIRMDAHKRQEGELNEKENRRTYLYYRCGIRAAGRLRGRTERRIRVWLVHLEKTHKIMKKRAR